jgi:hypothetical protein
LIDCSASLLRGIFRWLAELFYSLCGFYGGICGIIEGVTGILVVFALVL